WDQPDLSDLLQRVLVTPPRVLPSSRSTGSLDVTWSGIDLDSVQLTASGSLTANRRPRRRSDLPIDAAFALDLNGRAWGLSVDRLDVLGANASASLEGSLDTDELSRSTVGGTLQLQTSGDGGDWPRELVAAGLLDAPPPVRGPVSGSFVVSGTIGSP